MSARPNLVIARVDAPRRRGRAVHFLRPSQSVAAEPRSRDTSPYSSMRLGQPLEPERPSTRPIIVVAVVAPERGTLASFHLSLATPLARQRSNADLAPPPSSVVPRSRHRPASFCSPGQSTPAQLYRHPPPKGLSRPPSLLPVHPHRPRFRCRFRGPSQLLRALLHRCLAPVTIDWPSCSGTRPIVSEHPLERVARQSPRPATKRAVARACASLHLLALGPTFPTPRPSAPPSVASLAASGPPPHCVPCMPAQGSSEALRDKSPARCPSFPVEAQRRWSFFVNI